MMISEVLISGVQSLAPIQLRRVAALAHRSASQRVASFRTVPRRAVPCRD